MGLFEFFFRRSDRGSESGIHGNEPRCDHSTLTHVVLRQAAFDRPTQFVTELAAPSGEGLPASLWESVAEICTDQNQPFEIDPDDILLHKLTVGSWPCAIVEMPSAAFPTEAFFIALILTIDLADRDQGFGEVPLRYLTLEFDCTDDDEIQTVIGEWSQDGTHFDHGAGPEPTLGAFVTRIAEIIGQTATRRVGKS